MVGDTRGFLNPKETPTLLYDIFRTYRLVFIYDDFPIYYKDLLCNLLLVELRGSNLKSLVVARRFDYLKSQPADERVTSVLTRFI